MPELPEVETTRLGLLPVLGQTVAQVTVRNHGMRWPIPQTLPQTLQGLTLHKLERRAKYILATMQHGNTTGTLLLHLGMSGRLCLLEQFTSPEKHDHFDMAFGDGRVIRLRDPRRFGAVLWLEGDVNQHPLLASLGPEPLRKSRLTQSICIKTCAHALPPSKPPLWMRIWWWAWATFTPVNRYLEHALHRKRQPTNLALNSVNDWWLKLKPP